MSVTGSVSTAIVSYFAIYSLDFRDVYYKNKHKKKTFYTRTYTLHESLNNLGEFLRQPFSSSLEPTSHVTKQQPFRPSTNNTVAADAIFKVPTMQPHFVLADLMIHRLLDHAVVTEINKKNSTNALRSIFKLYIHTSNTR